MILSVILYKMSLAKPANQGGEIVGRKSEEIKEAFLIVKGERRMEIGEVPLELFNIWGKGFLYLLFREGKVCSIPKIVKAVWGNKKVGPDAVYKYIERMREKVEPYYSIEKVQGKGYRLRKNHIE